MILDDETAEVPLRILKDAAYLARLARGSSWPLDMADSVERAAERVISAWQIAESDADR